jgi:hypothetical protein
MVPGAAPGAAPVHRAQVPVLSCLVGLVSIAQARPGPTQWYSYCLCLLCAQAFISGGGRSDLYLVMARTGGDGASAPRVVVMMGTGWGLAWDRQCTSVRPLTVGVFPSAVGVCWWMHQVPEAYPAWLWRKAHRGCPLARRSARYALLHCDQRCCDSVCRVLTQHEFCWQCTRAPLSVACRSCCLLRFSAWLELPAH